MLLLKTLPQCFPKWLYCFPVVPAVSLHSCDLGLVSFSFFSRCVVISHYGFNLYFICYQWCWASFLLYLFAICMSSLLRYLVKSFLKIRFLKIYCLDSSFYVFWIWVPLMIHTLPVFSFQLWLSFHPLNNTYWSCFGEVYFIDLFFCGFCFLYHFLNLCLMSGHKDFPFKVFFYRF